MADKTTNTDMIDIFNIKPGDRVISITHPGTDEDLGIKVTIMSSDDERMRVIQRKITNKALDTRKRGKTFTAEQIEENEVRLLAEAIIDWDWSNSKVRFPDGSTPDFNRANVMRVLTDLAWFRTQINAEVGAEKDFFKV